MKAQAMLEMLITIAIAFSILLALAPVVLSVASSLEIRVEEINALDIQKQLLSACETKMITGEDQEIEVLSLSKAEALIGDNISIKTSKWAVSRRNPFKCSARLSIKRGWNLLTV